jgi:hypothetical protein
MILCVPILPQAVGSGNNSGTGLKQATAHKVNSQAIRKVYSKSVELFPSPHLTLIY